MDLGPAATAARPDGQNHDRIDTEMRDGYSAGVEHPSGSTGPTVSRTEVPEGEPERMDMTPDDAQEAVDRIGSDSQHMSEPAPAATSPDGAFASSGGPNGTIPGDEGPGTPVAPPAAVTEDLVRITSNGSSIGSSSGMDVVPPAPDGSAIPPPEASGIPPIPVPPQGPLLTPPPPPPPIADGSPEVEVEQGEESSDDEEDPWWTDLVEDTSTPNAEEVKEIEAAGPEMSALDCKSWLDADFVCCC